MESNKYIYLSYSHKDAHEAEKIASEIEGRISLNVWLAHKETQPGNNWEETNDNALKNASIVLTLVSPRYQESKWFKSDVEKAEKLNIPVIPVQIDWVDYSSLPDAIRKYHIAKYPEEQVSLLNAIVERKRLIEEKINENLPENLQNNEDIKSALFDDKTPFHKDSPSTIDYLGRKGFIEALAEWTDRYWTEYQTADKSFIINIHGQWGAGKTTFLNLLQEELQSKSGNDWIVVWFNAWENRHIKPEWWPLLDKIYRDSVQRKKAKKETVWHIKLREWWWRFYSGRKLDLLGFAVSLVVLAFAIYWVIRPGFLPDQHFLARVEATAKPITAILSVLSTIFLGTKFISRTVTFGSAKAAEVYLQFTPDPIENIKRHFNDLIEKKINKPVIVFIDDLDRCDRGYLVNLLESIQTLLNHRKVFYVIAADQRWLFAAFEQTYKEFKDSIKEPGKKIGYLFLEKIFQLSMSIPQISDEARAVYLDYLLGKEKKGQLEAKREQARLQVEEIGNEQELIEKVQSQESGSIEKVLIREAAVAKSASLEIEKETVHFLSSFAHLMDPNPRAIKRLVTFYGVQRAIAILCDEEIISDLEKRNQLALWTIVKMRWPLLADYLEEYPAHLKNFVSGRSSKEIHPDVADLVKDKNVRDVLKGKGFNTQLDEEALRQFIRLKATERTF